VSSRTHADGTPLSIKEVIALVVLLNKELPKHLVIKDLKKRSIAELDAALDRQDETKQKAADHLAMEGHRSRVTAAIRMTVCIRILTLMARDPVLLSLYKESLGTTPRSQNDAGSNPHVNPGQGMGLNHQFHVKLMQAFNTASAEEFPFEYFVVHGPKAVHSDGSGRRIPIPERIENGFLAGSGIKTAACPDKFPDEFFDRERLDTIFTGGITECLLLAHCLLLVHLLYVTGTTT